LLSIVRSMRARFSYIVEGEFSNADSCLLGRIHVSNGNRGAYGHSVTVPLKVE
jgi:hypothetical protein